MLYQTPLPVLVSSRELLFLGWNLKVRYIPEKETLTITSLETGFTTVYTNLEARNLWETFVTIFESQEVVSFSQADNTNQAHSEPPRPKPSRLQNLLRRL